MTRLMTIVSVLALGACADASKGAALNECRMRYYIAGSAEQSQLIPDCMRAQSFVVDTACTPSGYQQEWDWPATSAAYSDPDCYRSVGTQRWVATVLSPM